MKSFILAISMLTTVFLFIIFNAAKTTSCIDEMLRIAEQLPQTEAAFIHADHIGDDVIALTSLWDQKFPVLVYTAGYANTNRCDEAIGALAVYFQSRNASDFAVALSAFCDGLSRLRILEGIGWEGIF